MNFLAHAYLAGNNDDYLAGNLLADFVKGNGKGVFSGPVYQGILIHREIDRYTDQHEEVRLCKKILFPHIRHYAFVIVDVLFDHFLGRHWALFHSETLTDFTHNVYLRMEKFRPVFPEDFEWVFSRMASQDWLSKYANLDYLFDSFHGLARRSPGFIYANETASLIRENYKVLESHFLAFFPEIKNHIETLYFPGNGEA